MSLFVCDWRGVPILDNLCITLDYLTCLWTILIFHNVRVAHLAATAGRTNAIRARVRDLPGRPVGAARAQQGPLVSTVL
ncbi:hypothetical protein R5R35_000139 [Gryllus longicercus]|uniref:Uncharacterized protein n=1 Tax=Gryllus longicercus TaxID=2509291 RepID=A0AAN9YYP6_9ORTH